MTVRRRHEDPPMEDHSSERVVDWRQVAPRWLLLALVVSGWTIGGFCATFAWGQVRWRWEEQDRRVDEPLRKKVDDTAEAVVALTTRMRQYEELYREMDVRKELNALRQESNDVKTEVRILNLRLTKKIGTNGL